MISQNQDAFFRMLTEPSGGGSGGSTAGSTPAAGSAPGRTGGAGQGQGEEGSAEDYLAPGVIHVTPQDKEAIERVILKIKSPTYQTRTN